MRKDSPVENTSSEVEQSAVLAEGRRITAQDELVVILETKKKIQAETSLQESILSDLIRESKKILKDIEILKEEFSIIVDGQKLYIGKAKIERDTLNQAISCLIREVADLESKQVEAKDTLNSIVGKIKEADSKLSLLEDKLIILQKKEESLIESIRKSSEDGASMNNEFIKMSLEVGQIKSSIDSLLSERKEIEDKNQLDLLKLKSINTEIEIANNQLGALKTDIIAMSEEIKLEQEKIEKQRMEDEERQRLINIALTRVQDKTEYLNRIIEKAKVDGIISDFKI